MTFLVHIHEHAYAVADHDVRGVESQVVAAVNVGGAFIDIRDNDERPVRVLITSASPVRIEEAPGPVELVADSDAGFADIAYFDLDI